MNAVELLGLAMLGVAVQVGEGSGPGRRLPAHEWGRACPGDPHRLTRCQGATLDVGCGPGRLTAGLTLVGRPALGIDLVPEAVAQTRARGAAALVRDVFGPVPGEGRWDTVLLADGNIGIGGDPVALLTRARGLLGPGGVVVADLAGPERRDRCAQLWLRHGPDVCAPLPWAVVTVRGISAVAAAAGLVVDRVEEHAGGWSTVLRTVAA